MSEANERTYFDQHARKSPRNSVRKYYAIAKRSHHYFGELIRTVSTDKEVLEYGCGIGNFSFELATVAAHVTGIDISPESVATARRRATSLDRQAMVFEVMNAEAMAFPDESFDVVVGSAILHHLDLERASAEIMRVLRPGGHAIFLEPLGHNPALVLFRKLTPSMRTSDEHPLTMRELALLKERMGVVEYRFFHLCTLLAIPFLKTPFFWKLVDALDACDDVLFRVLPPLRSWSWFVTMDFCKPGIAQPQGEDGRTRAGRGDHLFGLD
ncbi:MAG: class I SAM-dependent methyltransferase [bacterium]|nr:class I SAM-dependent methyltransferase [bacterium]